MIGSRGLPKTKAAKLLQAIDACADDLEVMEAVAASAEEDATKVRAGARARVLEATAKLQAKRDARSADRLATFTVPSTRYSVLVFNNSCRSRGP